MKALRFTGGGAMELAERPMPEARDDWVVVRVTASGICGTDLELLLPHPSAVTPGHEGVGVVHAVDAARSVRPGQRVMIDCHVTCRRCAHCAAGDEIFCPELRAIGFDLDGTDAEYVAVPEASLRPLPDDISDEAGLLIGDALGTPYHAVKKADIRPGDFVGVWGVGPLGTMAAFCAGRLGARVIAVDTNPGRLARARQYGAAWTVDAGRERAEEAIRDITGGRMLRSAIQCTPSGDAVAAALRCLGLRGILVQVGVVSRAELALYSLLNERELTIRASRNFNAHELPELLDLARACPELDRLVTHRFPLERAAEAFACAAAGTGLKVALLPGG